MYSDLVLVLVDQFLMLVLHLVHGQSFLVNVCIMLWQLIQEN